MKNEKKTRLLARGESTSVELAPGSKLLISSGPVSMLLDQEEFLDLCGTLVHGLRVYRDQQRTNRS